MLLRLLVLVKKVVLINNKVLVKLIVPEIDKNYDLFLPINRKIGNIINLLNKTINELSNGEFLLSSTNSLYNSVTKEKYLPDILLANTNIRNGSVLILLS